MTFISFLIVFIAVIVALAAFKVFRPIYVNMHWYELYYQKAIDKAGAMEKQVKLPNGNVINYGEVPNDKPALLLIHGQMGSWEDYARLLPTLSCKWHVYAVDVYGHGGSSHNKDYYYIDRNADDISWFIDNVIKEPVVVAGHSNGALTTAYIGAYGSDLVRGLVLEDPPVFSTEGEGWENNFAYLDTYKPLHDWNHSDKNACWEEYYLSHCYWGQLFMKDKMPRLAALARQYHDKHPGSEAKIPFMPYTVMGVFRFFLEYDPEYGEHFYDLTWMNGHSQKDILSSIKVPCLYLHARESVAPTGVFLCAASREQAERAVGYIGDKCTLKESLDSEHSIHTRHEVFYLNAINSFAK